MSRFTHPSFAPRTLKQQTVCIVCQRWFCNIKNPDPKSKFYNTFQKPECYFLWLGDRADTPEAQAEYLAAPYSRKKGEGGLVNGWRQKEQAACGRCMNAAKSPAAQAKNEKLIKSKPRGNLCKECGNRAIDGHGKKPPCAACAAKRAAKAAASTT